MIHKELVKKEAVTEERLNEITGCLKGLQVTNSLCSELLLVEKLGNMGLVW